MGGLFKPPEELSAAVTMELLYYYALAHQDSFDVRWIKARSVAEQLIAPLAERLIAQHQLTVLGGTVVTSLNLEETGRGIRSVTTRSVATRSQASGTTTELDGVDAVVLAVG